MMTRILNDTVENALACRSESSAIMRHRFMVVLFIALSFLFAGQARRHATAPPVESVPQNPGASLTALTATQLNAFNIGRGAFQRETTVPQGLGPVFNEASCRDCHNAPNIGGGTARTVTRFATRTGGVYDPMTSFGGSLVQDHAIGQRDGSPHNFTRETTPPTATIVVRRRTTPLFGLGLVDATPDSTFIALAASSTSGGRVNMVDNIRAGAKTVGKFGWKAQVPTLFQFAGDASLNEMGVTNPDFPNENCPQGNCAELAFNPAPALNDIGNGVAALTDYMTMLAAPTRGPQTAQSIAGEQVFNNVGCAACHVATLATGSSTIASLDHKTYHPYSDFLLHNMGSLGDELEMGDGAGAEMRTAPLWGLRFIIHYLHDGRALTLDQAITAHDGQGAAARDAYVALSAADKAKLTAFLQSL